MEDFKNILYPVALTDVSPKVATYVVTMSRQLDAQVHLLHVLRRFDWFVDTYVSDPPKPDFKRIASDFESEVLAQAKKNLEVFSQRHLMGVHIANAVVTSGTHYKKILEYVKSESIDLIIMGTGTSMQNLIFGSVADKVSKLATVPVMLVKTN